MQLEFFVEREFFFSLRVRSTCRANSVYNYVGMKLLCEQVLWALMLLLQMNSWLKCAMPMSKHIYVSWNTLMVPLMLIEWLWTHSERSHHEQFVSVWAHWCWKITSKSPYCPRLCPDSQSTRSCVIEMLITLWRLWSSCSTWYIQPRTPKAKQHHGSTHSSPVNRELTLSHNTYSNNYFYDHISTRTVLYHGTYTVPVQEYKLHLTVTHIMRTNHTP